MLPERIPAKEAMPHRREAAVCFTNVAHAALAVMRKMKESAAGGPCSFRDASWTVTIAAIDGHLQFFENRRLKIKNLATGNEKAIEKPMRSVVDAVQEHLSSPNI